MTTTTGQAQHTIRRVLDAKRDMPGALLPILRDIESALPWLVPAAPEVMAGVAVYLQHCSDPAQRQALGRRLVRGEDAGLQALVCAAFHRLRAGPA